MHVCVYVCMKLCVRYVFICISVYGYTDFWRLSHDSYICIFNRFLIHTYVCIYVQASGMAYLLCACVRTDVLYVSYVHIHV
jgi:hypothetical protein